VRVVRCEQCGGCVVYDAATELAACLFCDSVALEPLDEPIPIPSEALAFAIDRGRAELAFRRWARSSWWHPRSLRSLGVSVAPLWIPAWRFEARLELHWAGLEAASTPCGRRPRAGVDRATAHAMLPASLGLTGPELDALQPFDVTTRVRWSEIDAGVPFEIPSLSASTARAHARTSMIETRRSAVAQRARLTRCRASAVMDEVVGDLLMLPVWIGSFRHRDRAWRFVVNAQSGKVHGRAPLDRLKVALTVALVLLVAAGVALWLWKHPPERPRTDSLHSSAHTIGHVQFPSLVVRGAPCVNSARISGWSSGRCGSVASRSGPG
jgi:hypothetical protein